VRAIPLQTLILTAGSFIVGCTPEVPPEGGTGGSSAGGVVQGGSPGTGGGRATGGSATGGSPTGGTAASGGTEQYPVPAQPPADEDGSELWLRYRKVPIAGRLAEYQADLSHVVRAGSSATLQAAQTELVNGLTGLTGNTVSVSDQPQRDGA
jgi:alpha-glucuronidase